MFIKNELARSLLYGALIGPMAFLCGCFMAELFIRFGFLTPMGTLFAGLLVVALSLEIRHRTRSKKNGEAA